MKHWRSILVLLLTFLAGAAVGALAVRTAVRAEVEQAQRKRLAGVRASRSDDAVRAALGRLADDAAHAERNLMPAIFDAVRAYATVGEMIGALADVFGRWEETAVI